MNYLLEFKEEKVAVLEMRSHIAWYLKGIPNSNDIKKEVFSATKYEELIKILDNFRKMP